MKTYAIEITKQDYAILVEHASLHADKAKYQVGLRMPVQIVPAHGNMILRFKRQREAIDYAIWVAGWVGSFRVGVVTINLLF